MDRLRSLGRLGMHSGQSRKMIRNWSTPRQKSKAPGRAPGEFFVSLSFLPICPILTWAGAPGPDPEERAAGRANYHGREGWPEREEANDSGDFRLPPEKGWFLRPSLVASQVGGRNLSLWFDKLTMQLDKHIKNRVCRLCSINERPHGGRTRKRFPLTNPLPTGARGNQTYFQRFRTTRRPANRTRPMHRNHADRNDQPCAATLSAYTRSTGCHGGTRSPVLVGLPTIPADHRSIGWTGDTVLPTSPGRLSSGGIGPVKPLLLRDRSRSWDRLPNCGGIGPVSWLPSRKRYCSRVSCPSSEGMGRNCSELRGSE